jgi:hypothetical protein
MRRKDLLHASKPGDGAPHFMDDVDYPGSGICCGSGGLARVSADHSRDVITKALRLTWRPPRTEPPWLSSVGETRAY